MEDVQNALQAARGWMLQDHIAQWVEEMDVLAGWSIQEMMDNLPRAKSSSEQTGGGGSAAEAAKNGAAGEAPGGSSSQKEEVCERTLELKPARDDLYTNSTHPRIARGPAGTLDGAGRAGTGNFASRRPRVEEGAHVEIEPEPPPAQTSTRTRTPAEKERRRRQKARRKARVRAEAAASPPLSRAPQSKR